MQEACINILAPKQGEQNVRMSAQAVGAAGDWPRVHGGTGRQDACTGPPTGAGPKGSLGGGGGFLHLVSGLSSCFLSIGRSDNALLTHLPGLLVDNMSGSVWEPCCAVTCFQAPWSEGAGGTRNRGAADSWCPRAVLAGVAVALQFLMTYSSPLCAVDSEPATEWAHRC